MYADCNKKKMAIPRARKTQKIPQAVCKVSNYFEDFFEKDQGTIARERPFFILILYSWIYLN